MNIQIDIKNQDSIFFKKIYVKEKYLQTSLNNVNFNSIKLFTRVNPNNNHILKEKKRYIKKCFKVKLTIVKELNKHLNILILLLDLLLEK